MSLEPDLDRIKTLSARELRGWYWAVFVLNVRDEEPGELERIEARAGVLKLDFSKVKRKERQWPDQ